MARRIRVLNFSSVILIIMAFASSAHAQGQVPDRGMLAVGFDAGVVAPSDDELQSAFAIGAYAEYYLTPRVSLRPGVLVASPQFGPEPDASLRSARFAVDGLYNWERGVWHPFVGLGLAIHRQRFEESDATLAEGTELGLDVLGGVEYFVSGRATIKAEAGFRPAGGLDGWPDPSAVTFTLGFKWYP
jgi:Outer membrane protein beta-barrel domain